MVVTRPSFSRYCIIIRTMSSLMRSSEALCMRFDQSRRGQVRGQGLLECLVLWTDGLHRCSCAARLIREDTALDWSTFVHVRLIG